MLPERDWLASAQRLAVGQSLRITHGRELRPNLVVHNKPDMWTCYCHSCKEGGVVRKDHVMFNSAPVVETPYIKPDDMVSLTGLYADVNTRYLADRVFKFLASKNMDIAYLECQAELYYSKKADRLILEHNDDYIGRSLRENHPAKWMTYDKQTYSYCDDAFRVSTAIIVEDTFSMYKTRWALRTSPSLAVISSLGTTISRALLLRIMESSIRTVIIFYDNDYAGICGADAAVRKLRRYGINALALHPPKGGDDPKDMDTASIFKEIQNRLAYTSCVKPAAAV